jgi:hypothetical protein
MPQIAFIELKADFPDDTVWMPSGQDIQRCGGVNVLNALAELLRARGLQVSEVWEGDLYNGLDVTVGPDGFKIVLNDFGGSDRLVIIEEDFRLSRWFSRRPAPSRTEFLKALWEVLTDDPRFSEMVWYGSHEDYSKDRPGAPPAD